MKTCFDCNNIMKEKRGLDSNGFEYNYYECIKCGERVLGMKQLHEVAESYRKIKDKNQHYIKIVSA